MLIANFLSEQLQKLYYGKNWTGVDLKTTLDHVDMEIINKQINGCNSIVTLLFHMNYYVEIQLEVLKGNPLRGTDKESFIHPEVNTKEDWEQLISRLYNRVDEYLSMLTQIPDDQFSLGFADEKWGSYYRNVAGMIEHSHYHLGQIVLLKKLLQSDPA